MRDLDLSRDVAEALAARDSLRRRLAGFAQAHQEEYLRWIEQARRPETRNRGIASLLELVERKA